jgi:hypothetical protein
MQLQCRHHDCRAAASYVCGRPSCTFLNSRLLVVPSSRGGEIEYQTATTRRHDEDGKRIWNALPFRSRARAHARRATGILSSLKTFSAAYRTGRRCGASAAVSALVARRLPKKSRTPASHLWSVFAHSRAVSTAHGSGCFTSVIWARNIDRNLPRRRELYLWGDRSCSGSLYIFVRRRALFLQ